MLGTEIVRKTLRMIKSPFSIATRAKKLKIFILLEWEPNPQTILFRNRVWAYTPWSCTD